MSRGVGGGLFAILLAAAAPHAVLAYSSGIVELEASQLHGGGGSVNGCRCHSSALTPPRTPTQVFVTGLPEAYEGGVSYPIRVWVLGASLLNTNGQPTGTAFAGFSLLVTGGELASAPGDASARVVKTTECALMQKQDQDNDFTGAPRLCVGTTCAVRVDPHCEVFDPSNPWCRTCDLENGTECRPCDDETALAWEATHTAGESGVSIDPVLDTVTIARTDGNNRIFWDLVWTAPLSGSGRVRINLAGNAANGNGLNDSGDIWNFGERMYLCEAGETCQTEDSGGGH